MEQVQYTTKRIVELESMLLVDVVGIVWPAEVGMVKDVMESVSHYQNKFVNMYLKRYPSPRQCNH